MAGIAEVDRGCIDSHNAAYCSLYFMFFTFTLRVLSSCLVYATAVRMKVGHGCSIIAGYSHFIPHLHFSHIETILPDRACRNNARHAQEIVVLRG